MSFVGKTLLVLMGAMMLMHLGAGQEANSAITVNLETASKKFYAVVADGQPNPLFIYDEYDCSWTLPTYDVQKEGSGPYYIQRSGLTETSYINITTVYKVITITYSSHQCSSSCKIAVWNGCARDITEGNYYDRVVMNVQDYPVELSYYVLCTPNIDYRIFSWGLIIQIVVICVLLCFVALHSRAWSLGGHGIQFGFRWAIAFCLMYIGVSLLRLFSNDGIRLCLWILSFGLGILGVAICADELLHLLKLQSLKLLFFKLTTFAVRLQQVLSLLVGVGVMIGWWFSNNNMICCDCICICMAIAFVKVFKFSSLKVGGLAILVTSIVQLVFELQMHICLYRDYNNVYVNQYNNSPFLLQLPRINAAYGLKCAWIPFTSIVFPGMLFAYLHRFDSSRATHLYLIIGMVTFSIGCVLWSIIISLNIDFMMTVASITEPCMFLLIAVFAYRRRELRVLWDGWIYNEEVGNGDLKRMVEIIRSGISARASLESPVEQLKEENRNDSVVGESSGIRTVFMNESVSRYSSL